MTDRLTRFREELDSDEQARRLLYDHELMGQLDELVTNHSPGGKWAEWARITKTFPTWADKSPALHAALGKVAALMREPAMAEMLSLIQYHEVNPKMRALGGYGAWLQALDEMRVMLGDVPALYRKARADARRLTGRRMKRDRRPPEGWRDRFCWELAGALREAGIEVAPGRQGAFAGVVRAALKAAGQDVPDDVYRLLRRALDAPPYPPVH